MSKFFKLKFVGLTLALSSANAQIALNPISSTRSGDAIADFGQSAAEIVSYDSDTKRMYVVNGATDSIDIFDISSLNSPQLIRSVDLSAYGNPNSVDVNPRSNADEVAVAVGSGQADVRGTVVFLTKSGEIADSVQVGYLPDMLTYNGSGTRLLVANEGEPSSDYSFDPEGSVSIIYTNRRNKFVGEISLTDIKEEDLNGARITGPPGTSIAQDLEPEYIALSALETHAFVACQENNALLVVNLSSFKVDKVIGLGSKNHAEFGKGFDPSDRDGLNRVANWPVKGLFMPDSIATYSVKGKDYIVTANEGDGRDYDGYSDESRVKDLEDDFELVLDESSFPLRDILVEDENLGRLTVITTEGDLDDDGELEELYSFGTRSFSIFSDDGDLVYDSGDFIESYLAVNFPDDFNSTNDESPSLENRSDNKGPEPEAIAIGEVDGVTYAFVGLERIGGIMVFDITDPEDVTFVTYQNNRDFDIEFDEDNLDDVIQAGDLGPEGIEFVSAKESPSGIPLILVANEVSGTTTVFEIVDETVSFDE